MFKLFSWPKKKKIEKEEVREEEETITRYRLEVFLNDGTKEIFSSSSLEAWSSFVKWFTKGRSDMFVLQVQDGEVCLVRDLIRYYRIFSYKTVV